MAGSRWMHHSWLLFVSSVLVVAASAVLAQTPEKAENYHRVLRSQPEPGYLFDRFYNAWLDEGTVGELEAFLRGEAEDGETSDRLLLAFFYIKQGETVEALRVLDAALEQAPDNATAWYHKAELRARTLDFEAALDDLAQARDAGAEGDLALKVGKLQGTLYARTDQPDEARQTWSGLLEEHPGDEYLYEDLIELQVQEGFYDEAIATLDRLIEQTADPYQQVLRRLRRGDIHQRAGRRDEALAVYAGTLDDVGDGTWLEREIYAQIEQVFRREEDLTGLREHYESLLAEHGQRVTLRRQYAELLSELGDANEAIEQWQQILALTPGERELREAYARVLADADRLDEAIAQLEQLVEQHPDESELRIRLAELQHDAGHAEAAGETLVHYLDRSDGSLFAHLRTARLLSRFELDERAAEVYERMVDAHPDDPSAHSAHADFLHEADRKDAALDIWRSLAVEADGATAVLNVARSLTARGEHEAAFDVLHARLDEFAEEPAYLGQMCELALRLERFEEALPWARRRLALVEDDQRFESALADTALLAEKAERLGPLVEELRGLERRTAAQTCLLAELLEQRGESAAADRVLAEAAAEGKAAERLLRQQVRLHRHRREWERAATTLERLIEHAEAPRTADLRELVKLYERAYEVEAALAAARRWKQAVPASPDPWVAEAELQAAAGDPDEGLETLRRAVQRFDENRDLRARLASAYRDRGKFADAQRLYQRLYEDSEDITNKLRWVAEMAQVAEARGRTRQLVEQFDQRRRTHRGSILPYLALAEIHRVNGNYEPRRQALAEASRLKPDDLTLLLSIARIEEREGDYERALATLRRAAELDTGGQAQQRMARIYLAQGREEEAYRLLYELAGGDQVDARGIAAIADAMAGNGDWQRAAEFLAEHRDRFPDNYQLAYLHGVALEEALLHDAAVDVFLDVLHAERELTNTGPAPATPWSGYTGELQRLLPAEALSIVEQQWHQHAAYSHQQGAGMHFTMAMGAAQSGASVQLPGDLHTARGYAIAHLRTIARMQSEERRDQIATAMREADVALADVLLDLSDNNFGNMPPQVIEAHGDEPGVAALWVMEQTQGIRPGVDGERAADYFELFRESHPQLALLAALVAAESDEQHHALLTEQALPLLEQVDRPSVFMLIGIASRIGGGPFGGGGHSSLPEELRSALTDRLLDWYPRVSQASGQMGELVFATVVVATMQDDDAGPFVRLLDEEVRRWRQRGVGAAATGAGMFMMGPQQDQFLQPLGFPPAELSDFPPHVLQMLGPIVGLAPDMHIIDGASINLEPAELAEHLDEVSDPALKVILAWGAEQPEVVQSELEKMLAAPRPRLDAYLLAAGYAADKQADPARAVELLSKARYLPMRAEMRRRVDGALVAWALEAPQDEVIGEAGQSAALRLRRSQLGPDQRQALVLAMEDLGLREEAERLQDAPSGGGMLGALGQMFGGGRSAPVRAAPSQQERIGELIDTGKTEAAVNLATRQLEQWAQASLSAQGGGMGGGMGRHEVERLVELLEVHSLTDEVLASAAPQEDASPLRRLRYAAVCDMLGEREQALAIYEAVAEERPDDGILMWRLADLVVDSDPERAADYLLDVPARSQSDVGQRLHQRMFELYHQELEPQIARFEMLAHWLDRRDADQTDGLEPVPALVDLLVSEQHVDGHQLPHLYDRRAEVPDELAELNDRRAAVHRRLSELMLEQPSLAREGFKHTLALAERDGDDLDPFIERARQILLNPPPPTRAGMGAHAQMMYHFSSSGFRPDYRTPEELLVRRAWQEDRPELIEEDLLAELREQGEADAVRRLEDHARLYFAAEGEFLEHASAHIEASAAVGPMPSGDASTGTRAVLRAWVDRDLDVDLVPLVVERIDEQMRTSGWFDGSAEVVTLAETLYQRRGPGAVRRLLEQIAEHTIGPAEEQAELVRKHFDRNHFQSGTLNARIHGVTEILGAFAERDPALGVIALEQYARLGLRENHLDYRLRESMSELVDGKSTLTLAPAALEAAGLEQDNETEAVARHAPLIGVLHDSALLADVEDFRPYRYGSGDEDSLFSDLANELHDNEDARQAVTDWLTEREAETFGAGLLAVMVRNETPTAVLNYLGERSDALAKMPDSQRQWLASVAATIRPGDEDDAEALTDAGRAIAEKLGASHEAARSEAVRRFMEADSLRELGVEPYNAGSHVEPLVTQLLTADQHEQVYALLDHALALTHEAERRGQHTTHYGGGRSSGGQLLEEALEDPERMPELAIVLRLVRDRRDPPVELNDWFSHRLVGELGSVLTEPEHDDPVEQLAAGCALLAEHWDDGDASALARWLHPIMAQRLDGDKLRRVVRWAEKPPAPADEGDAADEADAEAAQQATARLQREAAMIAAMILAEKDAENADDAEGGEDGDRDNGEGVDDADEAIAIDPVAHYRAVLEDEQLSPTYRLIVAAYLAEQAPQPALKSAAARFTGEALADVDVPVVDELLRAVVRGVRDGGEADDAAGREARAELLEGYLQRHARTSGRGGYGRVSSISVSSYVDRDVRPPMSVALMMLELALTQERSAAAGRLVREPSLQLGQQAAAWLLLARHGEHELAAQLIRRHANEVAPQYPEGIHFDAALAEALPQLLEELGKPGERLFAEAVLAAAPGAAEGQADREDRLRALADRIDEADESPELKQGTIMVLAQSDAALRRVAEPLAEIVRGWNGPSLLIQDINRPSNHQRDRRQMLYLTHIRAQALLGDPEAMNAAVAALATDDDDAHDWHRAQALDRLHIILHEVVTERLEALSPAQLGGFAPTLRVFADPPMRMPNYRRLYGYDVLNVLAHVAAGREEELARWREDASDDDSLHLQLLWPYAQDLLTKPEPLPLEQRLGVLKSLLADEVVQANLVDRGAMLPELLEHELLTDEELASHGAELASTGARQGQLWIELARHLAEHGSDEAVDDAWASAIEAVETDSNRLYLARLLVKNKRAEQARQVFASVDPVEDDVVQYRDEVLEELEELEAAEAPDEPDEPDATDAPAEPVGEQADAEEAQP